MTALKRTFALAEVNHAPLLVAKYLKLDVAGMLDQFFDVDAGAAEGLLGFGARRLETRESILSWCGPCAFRARRRHRRL